MKNKEITIYELMGLIKDDKAPKKIKLQDTTYEYDKNINGYFDKNGYNLFYLVMNRHILNDTVEILPKENDEWEDIEEIDINLGILNMSGTEKYISNHINQLIKNQRKIIEKLEEK